MREGRRIQIRGTVQGVGFRPFVYRLAREEGIGGRVLNDAAGVTIEVFGAPGALESFFSRLTTSAPPAAAIQKIAFEGIPDERVEEFAIVPSGAEGERTVSIPPDIATCVECLLEVFDPLDRRFEYPFTNCTNCGPRFTIANDIPYDRPATTMAPFHMCPACGREYQSPLDRRFHAQPNACPDCGPRLRMLAADGSECYPDDVIASAAQAICAGLVVAVKGIGGFHLACDATSSDAVARLRRRKHRDEKPFAVMVRDLEGARRIARTTPPEEALLASAAAPIVLLDRRPDAPLAPEVAPGNPLVGILLAYTPLHHLLLAAAGRPLVMTSGNRSEEPMASANAEAVVRLSEIADIFLVHDRDIATRADDSVARVIAGRPTVLRRSRGYVPGPIAVRRAFARPVLACGGQLKNTFCIGRGENAYLGPHAGDLDNLESFRAYEDAIQRMEKFLQVEPEILAHDLHPEYLSTVYARRRPETEKIAVQHHHAHVASAMAEHGIDGPVIGVAFDGTGYGTDGTAWGAEVLLADFEGFERLGTFRAIPLPGGDAAIREVWRIALALVEDAFGGDPPLEKIPLFREIAPERLAVVRRMLAERVACPRARGIGRYFDGLGALVLGRAAAAFEGQAAMEWNFAADRSERSGYPYSRTVEDGVPTVDLRPLVRAAVEDLAAGRPPATISARFHNALARATTDLVRDGAEQSGRRPVVLTGGCFQNALLTERVIESLGPEFDVRRHGRVPPGDGGLALGQALVADAVARRRGGV